MIDDLDGTPAQETVQFGLDGRDYEIDLSGKHARELRTELDPYLQVAQRVSHNGRSRPASAGSMSADENAAIRQWAEDNGIAVAPRGRIAASIVERYHTRPRSAPKPAPLPVEKPTAKKAVKAGRASARVNGSGRA
jgi:hypothetical protein